MSMKWRTEPLRWRWRRTWLGEGAWRRSAISGSAACSARAWMPTPTTPSASSRGPPWRATSLRCSTLATCTCEELAHLRTLERQADGSTRRRKRGCRRPPTASVSWHSTATAWRRTSLPPVWPLRPAPPEAMLTPCTIWARCTGAASEPWPTRPWPGSTSRTPMMRGTGAPATAWPSWQRRGWTATPPTAPSRSLSCVSSSGSASTGCRSSMRLSGRTTLAMTGQPSHSWPYWRNRAVSRRRPTWPTYCSVARATSAATATAWRCACC
mmetsp:Transcript_11317/g.32105  ORF Transcript_11317/g.32105 Transcript_11317/m.32105 type:complete len:268 (-) Transcript_11317:1206-2009(-)